MFLLQESLKTKLTCKKHFYNLLISYINITKTSNLKFSRVHEKMKLVSTQCNKSR